MTDILDILGVVCLACFAAVVWPPAVLLVIGAAMLIYSWASER